MATKPLSVFQHFAQLPDPRMARCRRHNLLDIISIAICGAIAGCKGWVEIEVYGRQKRAWFQTFLELPNGIPTHDTFGRVFARLNPQAFAACFQNWIQALAQTLGLQQIAIDGKTLRRSHDRGLGKSALHLVSAWATTNGVSLGQVAVDDKSNEITAIPALLDLLDLAGALVSIYAMGCQKEIATKIRSGGGHYVLAVKGNQEHLLADVQECFRRALEQEAGANKYTRHDSVERRHGRLEKRHCYTIDRPRGLRELEQWTDLRTISMVVSERQVSGQATTEEVRYYIGSKPGQAADYAGYVRGHWGIENSLHWVLDVVLDEDRSRLRKDHSTENFALLRRLAVSILRNDRTCKGSIRTKQMQAMMDDAKLTAILGVFAGN